MQVIPAAIIGFIILLASLYAGFTYLTAEMPEDEQPDEQPSDPEPSESSNVSENDSLLYMVGDQVSASYRSDDFDGKASSNLSLNASNITEDSSIEAEYVVVNKNYGNTKSETLSLENGKNLVKAPEIADSSDSSYEHYFVVEMRRENPDVETPLLKQAEFQ